MDINYQIGLDITQALDSMKELSLSIKKGFSEKIDNTQVKGMAQDFNQLNTAAKQSLNEQKAALAAMVAAGKGGGAAYNEMLNSIKQTINETNKLDEAMKQVEGDIENVGKSKFDGVKSSFKDIGQQALGIAGGFTIAGVVEKGVGLVTDSVKKVINVGMDYQTSMAEFSAITGVTGKQLDNFGIIAQDMAKKFGGSALDQISSFKGLLSRLGPDIAKSPEALQSMTDSINTLAKAGSIDAQSAMDSLTTAMLQFNVSLDDPKKAAGEMAKMMNVMAAGAKEGAAEIPQIKEALVVSGVAAKGAKVSFEETNAAIQVLATGGKYGAEAGIALRNVLGKIAGEDVIPKEAAQKLKSLGVDMNKVSDTSKPLADRLKELSKASKDATAFAQVFGTENAAAAAILANGTDKLVDFTTKMTGTKTAVEQAAITMNTWAEKQKRMQAAIESFGLGIFNNIIQPIGDAIMSFIDAIWTNALQPLFDGIFNGIAKGFQPLFEAITSLWNELSKLWQSTGEGVNIMGILKDVFTVVGSIIGGVLKIAIQAVLIPLKLLIDGYKLLLQGINFVIDAFKKFISGGNPVAVFIRTLWEGFKNLLGTIGSVIEKVLQFLGILDKKTYKAPIADATKNDLSKAAEETDKGGEKIVKSVEKTAKSVKDAFKLDSSGVTKYLSDVKTNIEKINNEELKDASASQIKNLEVLKEMTLKNETILGSERLKIAQDIEDKIAKLKTNQLIEDAKTKLDIDNKASDDKATAELKKLQDILDKEKTLSKTERSKINGEILKIVDAWVTERERLESQSEKKITKIQSDAETERTKARADNQKKIDEAVNKDRINSIQNIGQRTLALEIDNAKKIFEKRLEEVKGNQELELAAYTEFLAAKQSAEEKAARESATNIGKLGLDLAEIFAKNAASVKPSTAVDNTKEIEAENKKFADSKAKFEQDLKDKKISYETYLKELNKLESDHTAEINKLQASQVDGWKIVADIIANTFKELAAKRAEEVKVLIKNYDDVNGAIKQQAQLVIDTEKQKGNASAEYAAETQRLSQLTQKHAEILAQVYQATGEQVGAAFVGMVASGQNAGKALAKAALSGLKSLVPILIAEIFGQSLAQLGPIGGAIAAAGLSAVFYGLIAVAEASIGAETGYLPGQKLGKKGRTDTQLIWFNPKEAIISEQNYARNKSIIDSIQMYGHPGGFNDNNIVKELQMTRQELAKHKSVEVYDRRVIDINDNRSVQVRSANLYR